MSVYVCDCCSPNGKLAELLFDLLINLVIRVSLSEQHKREFHLSVCLSVCTFMNGNLQM